VSSARLQGQPLAGLLISACRLLLWPRTLSWTNASVFCEQTRDHTDQVTRPRRAGVGFLTIELAKLTQQRSLLALDVRSEAVVSHAKATNWLSVDDNERTWTAVCPATHAARGSEWTHCGCCANRQVTRRFTRTQQSDDDCLAHRSHRALSIDLLCPGTTIQPSASPTVSTSARSTLVDLLRTTTCLSIRRRARDRIQG
jgi:hypothetical protein